MLFVILFAAYLYKHREETAQKIIRKKHHATIVMFGDSHTANGNWSFLLKRFDVKRSGHGGFTSGQLVNLLDKDVIQYKPELCFFQLGGNDIRSEGFSMDTVVENFSRLISLVQKHDIKPVAQSLFYRLDDKNYNAIVDSLNHRLVIQCQNQKVDYLDINSRLNVNGLNPDYFNPDGIHLNKEGYKLWAKDIRNYLSSHK